MFFVKKVGLKQVLRIMKKSMILSVFLTLIGYGNVEAIEIGKTDQPKESVTISAEENNSSQDNEDSTESSIEASNEIMESIEMSTIQSEEEVGKNSAIKNENTVTKITVPPRGDISKDQVKERRNMLHSDLEITGIFLEKGQSINVLVKQDPENLSVSIGQYGIYDDLELDSETNGIASMETFALQAGNNEISRASSSGMVYLVNKSNSETIEVEISGGTKIPLLKVNSTVAEQEQFYNLINSDGDYPFFELEGNYIFGTFQNSQKQYLMNVPVSQIIERLNYWDFCFNKTVEFYGFDNIAGHSASKNMAQRIHVTNPDSGPGYASANHRRITFQVDTGASKDLLTNPLDQSQWGFWHEIGHTFQTPQYLFPDMIEVTVNFSALYIQESLGMNLRIDEDSIRTELKNFMLKDRDERDFYELGLISRLAVFWTFHRVFGSDYYKAVSQLYRATVITDLPEKNSEISLQVMIQLFSQVANRNLTPFFLEWGLYVSEETLEICQSYPNLEKDIWLDISGEGESFDLKGIIPRYTIPTVSDSEKINLSIFTSPKQAILESVHSYPLESNTFVDNIYYEGIGSSSKYSNNIVRIGNENNVFNLISIDEVTGNDSVVFFGNYNWDSRYKIFGLDTFSKRFRVIGKGENLHGSWGESNYISVKHYDSELKVIKNEVSINGSGSGSNSEQLKEVFDNKDFEVNDIVRINHEESHIRLNRYMDDELLPLDNKKVYFYRILETGWEEIDLSPNVIAKTGVFKLGLPIDPNSLIDIDISKNDIPIKKIEYITQPDYSSVGSTTASIQVTNEVDLTTTVNIENIIIEGGEAAKFFGQGGTTAYQIIVPNPDTKKFSMIGKSGYLHSYFPNELYVSIAQYDHQFNLLNRVEVSGTEDSQKLADQFDGQEYSVGDLICLEHVESHIRLDRYQDNSLLEKDSDKKYWYKMTEKGWEEIDLSPKVTPKTGVFKLGLPIDPNSLISNDSMSNELPIKKVEYIKQPDYSSPDTTEAIVKVTNEIDLSTTVNVENIKIEGGNAVKFFGQGGTTAYQIIVPDPDTQKISVLGKSGYLHSYFPNELYISISQYNHRMNLVKKVELTGTEDSQKLADQFDGQEYKVGDFICLEHVESHIRIDRYQENILLEKDNNKKYWYEMTETGWIPLDEEPIIADDEGIGIVFVSNINFGVTKDQNGSYKAILDNMNELPNIKIASKIIDSNAKWTLVVSKLKDFTDDNADVIKGATITLKDIYLNGISHDRSDIALSSTPQVVVTDNFKEGAHKVEFGKAVEEENVLKTNGVTLDIPKGTTKLKNTYSSTLLWELISDPTY